MLRTKALLIALAAASADAANLRASESRRLAGHGGHDDGDCHDDPEWHHKNRGPDYDCAWVAKKPDTRCSVNGVSGKVEGTVVASDGCKEACGGCEPMPGADDDGHGCKPSTGYMWCESLGECVRSWETDCPDGTSDADKCVDAGGYPVYIGPTPNDMLCKFPCGNDWTDCPIGRDPSTSPPCPPDNPEASFAVPSQACLDKCKVYIEPFCEQFDYPAVCTSEVDGPFLNLAGRCLTLGGGVAAEPSAEPLDGWVACPAIWAPVCGADGVTWDSDCVANAHGVTDFVDGECDKPCTKEYVPVCGADGVTYGNKCLAENAGNAQWTDGACEEPCTKELVPVCGADGQTYNNACLAENAGVEWTDGACEEPCTKELVPVCGSDGQTYNNACLAENAGVTYTEGACEQ